MKRGIVLLFLPVAINFFVSVTLQAQWTVVNYGEANFTPATGWGTASVGSTAAGSSRVSMGISQSTGGYGYVGTAGGIPLQLNSGVTINSNGETFIPNLKVNGSSFGFSDMVFTKVAGQPLSFNTGFSTVSYMASGTRLYADYDNNGDGTLSSDNGLYFGSNSTGEAITSRRTAGTGQNGLNFFTGSQQRMSILNNGNIGIGTAAAPAKLSISPSNTSWTNTATSLIVGKDASVLGNTAGAYSYIGEYQQSTTTPNINRLQTTLYRRVAGSAWQGAAYRIQYAVDHEFTTGSKAYMEIGASDPNSSGLGFISFGTEGADRLSITGSGNVGIGTTNPTAKLAVAGTILGQKVMVYPSGNTAYWPDYVFESSYNLPALSSLESFIQYNKHLPDVPSATEVAKDGLDLGTNQAVLLKKIEELTLYLIEQGKKIEKLQKENEEIKILLK